MTRRARAKSIAYAALLLAYAVAVLCLAAWIARDVARPLPPPPPVEPPASAGVDVFEGA